MRLCLLYCNTLSKAYRNPVYSLLKSSEIFETEEFSVCRKDGGGLLIMGHTALSLNGISFPLNSYSFPLHIC